jgi:hypothetical protein
MWPYNDHSEEEYYKAIRFVEDYAVSLGAEYVCTKEEKFTTFAGDKTIIEISDMRVFKYGDEYFWIEHHFLEDCPFMVFSFGDTIETIFDDMEPFPYNLEEDELKAEVRYSLGIEEYPKA